MSAIRFASARFKPLLVITLLALSLAVLPGSVRPVNSSAASVPSVTLYVNCLWERGPHATGPIWVLGYNQNLNLSNEIFPSYFTWLNGNYYWYATGYNVSIETWNNGQTVGWEFFYIPKSEWNGAHIPVQTASC